MRNFIEIDKGMNFFHASQFAKEEARKNGTYVMFKFNDIVITISHDSNLDDIAIIYDLKRKIRRETRA